ncbi:MAG: restriction endonuclease [archaeon]|uniref:Restriction endonuclease n=1 Tax=Methanobrevibacter gottschalkii DSM 11977 TaxID=1122229 RepID=A0A3N5B568_9EURY|nr:MULTISPECIES: restriction endonuclease [Methanobrevibacter]MCQ2970671.1 restriction endonuclease [archaeon]OEC96556.1 restriction endonuclease [Methanobrevibacter sp. A27]RPF52806.1 restriction endonuclease [Methanobrevibacter gottschalkii DSM 11977]
MEKPQLINFIAKVMEDSGFKVYKNFKTSQRVIDIYAILPTTIGDFGVVVACKNYDKDFKIGVDVLREMEEVQQSIKASKVTIVSSSYFSDQAKNYALRKNIKLVDRDNLLELAKKYQDRTSQTTLDNTPYDGGASQYIEDEYPEYTYDASDMEYLMRRREQNPAVYKNTLYRQIDEDRHTGFSSILNRGSSRNSSLSGVTNLYNYQSRKSTFGQDSLLFNLVKNPIVLIILVVAVSYIISYIAGNLLKVDAGISGLIEMIVALFLSYGLSLYTDRNRDFIVKGTFIFFISLIILIILIFV